MSQLVEALKAEHANIVAILTRVHDLGIDTEEGRKTLRAAKTGLLNHLSREDEQLYPVLQDAAKEDPIVADALEFFMEDMKGVSQAALDFFEKFETPGEDDAFAEDFSGLVTVLSRRIQQEESVIYSMYDQIALWGT